MTLEEFAWWWLEAITTGQPVPGEYVPGTNPLDVFRV
jgi:hypothetical protein